MRWVVILVVGITLFSEFTPMVRAQSLGQPVQADPTFLAEINERASANAGIRRRESTPHPRSTSCFGFCLSPTVS